MSFWKDSKENVSTTFEANTGGNFEPIPDGTHLDVMIEKVEWRESEHYDAEFISLTYLVMYGDHVNRKIFQKLHVLSSDEKKSKKALDMFASIDAICGGNLIKVDDVPPEDVLVKFFQDKALEIGVNVYDIYGDGKNVGNWVYFVSALGTPVTTGGPTDWGK